MFGHFCISVIYIGDFCCIFTGGGGGLGVGTQNVFLSANLSKSKHKGHDLLLISLLILNVFLMLYWGKMLLDRAQGTSCVRTADLCKKVSDL